MCVCVCDLRTIGDRWRCGAIAARVRAFFHYHSSLPMPALYCSLFVVRRPAERFANQHQHDRRASPPLCTGTHTHAHRCSMRSRVEQERVGRGGARAEYLEERLPVLSDRPRFHPYFAFSVRVCLCAVCAVDRRPSPSFSLLASLLDGCFCVGFSLFFF